MPCSKALHSLLFVARSPAFFKWLEIFYSVRFDPPDSSLVTTTHPQQLPRLQWKLPYIHQPRDPNTLSDYNNWRTTHTATHIHILFDEHRLKGSVTLNLKSITKCRDQRNHPRQQSLQHIIGEGRQLSVKMGAFTRMEPLRLRSEIHLDKAVPLDKSVTVTISVSTTSSCIALQWLTPATRPGKNPYLSEDKTKKAPLVMLMD
jgi:hypothetical protein